MRRGLTYKSLVLICFTFSFNYNLGSDGGDIFRSELFEFVLFLSLFPSKISMYQAGGFFDK